MSNMIEIGFYIMLLNFIVIVLCITVSRFAVRGMDHFASILDWWSVALTIVAIIHLNRVLVYPKAFDGPFATMFEMQLSNLSNLAVLALSRELANDHSQRSSLKIRNGIWVALLSLSPIIFIIPYLALAGFSGVGSARTYEIVTKIVASVFSWFVFVRLALLLSTRLVSLVKSQTIWFTVYGFYQLLFLVFCFQFRFLGLESDIWFYLYLSVSAIFKVAATFLLVAAASELAKSNQLAVLAGSRFGTGEPRKQRHHSRDVDVCFLYDTLRPDTMEELAAVFSVAHVRAHSLDTAAVATMSAKEMRELSYSCRFVLCIFTTEPHVAAIELLEAMLAQRKGGFVLQDARNNWGLRRNFPAAYLRPFEDESEVPAAVLHWARTDVQPAICRLLWNVPIVNRATFFEDEQTPASVR